MTTTSVTRRDFLKVTALAGGGMLVEFRLDQAAAQQAAPFKPNAWVSIAPSGTVTLTCHRNEMGQDVHTSLSMLLAEELGVNPRRVTVVQELIESPIVLVLNDDPTEALVIETDAIAHYGERHTGMEARRHEGD